MIDASIATLFVAVAASFLGCGALAYIVGTGRRSRGGRH